MRLILWVPVLWCNIIIYYLTQCSHSLCVFTQTQWSRYSVGDVLLIPRPRQDILGAATLRGQSSLTFLPGRIYFLRFFPCLESNFSTPSKIIRRGTRLIRVCKAVYINIMNLISYGMWMTAAVSSGHSSWLQIGDVLCFLWSTNSIYICYVEESDRLWSSGQSSWLQIRRPGFDSLHYQKKKSSGSGTGSTQPREYNWGATW
jgi:ribosomal protein L37E